MSSKEMRPRSDSDSGFDPSYKDLLTGSRIWGVLFFLLACFLTIFVFVRFGRLSSDMLTITGYVVDVPTGQERVFGYGGIVQTPDPQLRAYARTDVPFQSRTMSSLCFAISQQADGSYQVKGLEDRIWVGGQSYDPMRGVPLSDGLRFKTDGRFGSAVFIAHLEQQGRVRLELSGPLHYRLSGSETRLTLGLFHDIVDAPVNELYVRTSLRESQVESFKLIKGKERDGYFLQWEEDLARTDGSHSEVLASLDPTAGNPVQESFLESGAVHPLGTVLVQLTRSGRTVLGLGPAALFGFKLSAALLVLALLFGFRRGPFIDTQILMPNGSAIFGAVTLLAVVGICLGARDYFRPPYDQSHFSEYIGWLLRGTMILYFLRIPQGGFLKWRWLISLPMFVLVFLLLNQPFESWLTPPSFRDFGFFIIQFFLLALLVGALFGFAKVFITQALRLDWWRGLGFIIGAIAIVFVVAWVAGGREAMILLGKRVHLPTLLLPLVVLGTCFVVVATEALSDEWQKARNLGLAIMFFVAGSYYVFSARGFSGGDHGGAFILGVGVFISMWVASHRSRPWAWTVVLAVLFVISLFILIKVAPHERVGIAWGGEEGAGRFFDAAVNLRTGRDLARSGGLWGSYDSLYIPSSISTNYYNDLVTAYVAGFFGLLGLAAVALAYYIIYTRLFDGLTNLMNKKENQKSAAPTRQNLTVAPQMPPLFEVRSKERAANLDDTSIHVWRSYGLSMVMVLLFQLLWVSTATLWGFIPFSGLDLQPLSSSVISILGFMVLLLGSVAWVYRLFQGANEGGS